MKNTSPSIFSILTLIIISLIVLLPIDSMFLKMSFSNFHSEYVSLIIKMGFIFIISYSIIKKMKIYSIAGLSSKYDWKFKYLNLIPMYLIIIGVLNSISKDLTQLHLENVLLLLIACLTVGFAEEFLFRGVLQSIFFKKYIYAKNGILISTLVPAIIFGLFHFINLTKNDDTLAVLIQVIFATFIGFFFGVLVIKTNKIIPIAITHGLINFFFSITFLPGIKITEEIETSIFPIILTLPLFIIGLVLIQKIKKEDVFRKLR